MDSARPMTSAAPSAKTADKIDDALRPVTSPTSQKSCKPWDSTDSAFNGGATEDASSHGVRGGERQGSVWGALQSGGGSLSSSLDAARLEIRAEAATQHTAKAAAAARAEVRNARERATAAATARKWKACEDELSRCRRAPFEINLAAVTIRPHHLSAAPRHLHCQTTPPSLLRQLRLTARPHHLHFYANFASLPAHTAFTSTPTSPHCRAG